MPDPPAAAATDGRRARPAIWVASSYFAEGYPYALINNLAEVLLSRLGVGLGGIGLTAAFHLPWNLKFLWAPLVDEYETKRRWLLAVEIGLCLAMGLMAALATPRLVAPLLAVFAVAALFAATHDVAIDGFYLEALAEDDQSRFVGVRQMSYRLAILLVRGPLVVLAGYLGWHAGLAAAAGLMAAVTLLHAWLLPRSEVRRRRLSELAAGTGQARPMRQRYRTAFVQFVSQPRAAIALAFIITFRTGESFLLKMQAPFLLNELKLSTAQFGTINGTFGVITSLAGTLLGAHLIARHGLRRWIWPFVVAQNGLHVLYALLAHAAGAGPVGLPAIAAVICVEHFGEGLGTAVLTIFLLRCCHPEHKAAHMALLTAVMSLGFTVAGAASGFLAGTLGFARYFGFTFAVTVPSMALIFFLPHLDGEKVVVAEAAE